MAPATPPSCSLCGLSSAGRGQCPASSCSSRPCCPPPGGAGWGHPPLPPSGSTQGWLPVRPRSRAARNLLGQTPAPKPPRGQSPGPRARSSGGRPGAGSRGRGGSARLRLAPFSTAPRLAEPSRAEAHGLRSAGLSPPHGPARPRQRRPCSSAQPPRRPGHGP